MNVGDVLQWKDFQTMTGLSGEVLNVFYFEILSMTTPQPIVNVTDALATFWYDTFLAPVLAMQSNQVIHTRSEVNNLNAFTTDFGTVIPAEPVAGSFAGEYLAPSTAWSFQLVRTTRETRNGSKRIAGVPEGLGTNNIPSGAARLLADDVRLMWETIPTVDLNEVDTMVLRMVIPKTPVTPGALPTVFNPVSAVVFRGLGSQNSRKELRPS